MDHTNVGVSLDSNCPLIPLDAKTLMNVTLVEKCVSVAVKTSRVPLDAHVLLYSDWIPVKGSVKTSTNVKRETLVIPENPVSIQWVTTNVTASVARQVIIKIPTEKTDVSDVRSNRSMTLKHKS